MRERRTADTADGGQEDPQPPAGPRRGTRPLTHRRVTFAYPDDFEPGWNRRYPEFAYAANGVSLLMPYAEPYFVKSVRTVLPELDGELRARSEDYLRQELAHHVQHRRFNDLIGARHPRIRTVERWMRRTYGWFSDTRSARFNLAFAAGSETIAYALARWTEKHVGVLFTDADPVPATLFLWHLAEEVEHKTAAYDVFEAIDGSRMRYALAMTISCVILCWFTVMSTLVMLASDRRALHPARYFRLTKWFFSLAFEMLPTMVVSALPGHHPSALTDPPWLSRWLGQYDPASGTLPLWTTR